MNDSSKHHKIKAIVFDFDGTLADSFPVFVHAVEYALKRRPFTAKEIKLLRQHSARQVIRILKVKQWKLPWLVMKGAREMDRHQSSITSFPDIPEVISELSKLGYKLYIVSSHSERGIKLFLKHYKLSESIERIYAHIGLFGKPKALKKLQSQFSYKADECVFIGDEVRDIEAASKAGVDCIAVTWGFNTAESLKTHNPHSMAHKPKDLVTAIQALS